MRALVTGAASGIGLATARKLHQESCRRDGRPACLLMVDIDRAALDTAVAALIADGAEAHGHVCDLGDPDTPARSVAAARQALGGLDALISNAGILRRDTLLDLSTETFDRTFAVNTRATWLLAKAAYPLLKDARGCLVATTSIAAHEPCPAIGAYAASKAALLMIVRQLACDWGPDGIRCNSVSPGETRTNISGARAESEEEAARANNPLGFVGDPRDQAAAIAFLASPEARFINGADLVVDGGARTQLMQMSGMARAD